MALAPPAYLARVDVAALFARLRVPDAAGLARAASEMDDGAAAAEEAAFDGALGPEGAEAIGDALLAAGAMNPAPALLDLTARGPGLVSRVDAALRARSLRPRWSAMAGSPAALRRFADARAVPFLGALRDIEGSVREAAMLQPLPPLFDGAIVALALAPSMEHEGALDAVLAGVARVLAHGAPLIVVEEAAQVGPGHLEAVALERFRACEVRPLSRGRFLATLSR
jgi:hypothetical protein